MIKKFRSSLTLIFILSISACSTITPIEGESLNALPSDQCNVKVYQTVRQAEKHGKIKELCIITGTSSGSFSHTVNTAISKHKGKACKCGSNKVYVESRTPGTDGLATVTLIAFEYEK